MAAQTITGISNLDDASISGLLNGEAVTINGGELTLNSDNRWSQQAAVFGSMPISSSLGGKIKIDGSTVWLLPFDASTGVVPTLGVVGTDNVTGSIAGEGEFLGVWAAGAIVPTTAGSAMPSSGFIKLRKKSIDYVDNEVVTFSNGATATINSATGGHRGWIHIVGAELGTFTVPRLGSFETNGDWFYLGETNGTDDQTFQFPVADCCPAFQMETSVGSGVYEWWLNAGGRWGTATQFVSTDERGKLFGIDNTTGVITIAKRAANACGYKPVSGLKVRIPNIICSSSTAANWNTNTINATLASRYDFTTTSAGSIDINFICANWYLSFTGAYQVDVKNSVILHAILCSNVASTTTIDNLAIGLNLATDISGLNLTNLFTGGEISNVRVAKYSSAVSGAACITISDCDSLNLTNCMSNSFGALATTERGIANSYAYALSRHSNSTLENCSAVCGYMGLISCSNLSIIGYKYCDRMNGTTTALIGITAISLSSGTVNTLIDGFSSKFPSISNIHPYIGIIAISGSYDTKVVNVGSPSSPYNCGSANQVGIFLTAAAALGIELRRCYLDNLRTAPLSLVNTVQNVICENVWGDGLDSQAIAALNITAKGCRWNSSLIAQTSCYGRHWEDSFLSTTSGNLTLIANEPLPSTASQVSVLAGNPRFDSLGNVTMTSLGDQIEWVMPYYALGITKLGGYPSTIPSSGGTTENIDFDYALDTGSGFGSYKPLVTVRNRQSGGVAGTNNFLATEVPTARPIQIGDYVTTVLGTHFNSGTTVTGIAGTTTKTITLSQNILVSLPANTRIGFVNDLETESSFSAATGAKIKVRATTNFASVANIIAYIRVATVTDSVSQQIQYPLPVTLYEGKVSGIEAGSRIRVYNVATSTEIANEIVSGTEWVINYAEGTLFTGGDQVEIRIAKVDGLTAYLPQTIVTLATTTGWAALASQELDAVYNFNAIDGSTVTELTGDYPNVQIDSNDADGETTVQRIYAWFAYNQTTADGITDFFEAMLAEDEVNYRVRTTIANLKLDNTISTPLMIVGGRIYRDDGATVIASASNSIQLDPDKAYAVEASGGGGSGLTANDVWSYSVRTLSNASVVRTELAPELAAVLDNQAEIAEVKNNTVLIPALL